MDKIRLQRLEWLRGDKRLIMTVDDERAFEHQASADDRMASVLV